MSSRKHGRRVSSFVVPKYPEHFEAWSRAVHHADKPLDVRSVLCELHFDEQYKIRDFTHVINGKTVKIPHDSACIITDAVPTIYPNVPP